MQAFIRTSERSPTGQHVRWHLHESAVSRSFRAAVQRSGIGKRATTHSLRHSFATQLLAAGYGIRPVPELLGHASVERTLIYSHALESGRCPVRSPLDPFPTRRPAAINGNRFPPIPNPATAANSAQTTAAQTVTERESQKKLCFRCLLTAGPGTR